MTATRTILVSGDAGAPTVAAATALHAAGRGHRTWLLAADDPHRALDSVLGTRLEPEPVRYAPGLTVSRIDEQAAFRYAVGELTDRLKPALDLLGAEQLDPEELTALPGIARLALLRALPAADQDVLVVLAPPPAELIATLALPEQLTRYLDRLVPEQRQAARALRPLLAGLAGVPMPAEWLYETAARWDVELAAVEAVLADRTTAVRLVAEPGPAGADAVHAATLGLALRGLRTEALVASRVLPDTEPDTWLAGLLAQQRKALADWQESYDVHPVAHLGRDPRGRDDLAALAVPGVNTAPTPVEWPVADRIAEDGVLVWRIPLPGALRDELDLIRRGDELVIAAGQFHRIVSLPSALRRCTVAGAALREGELCIRFAPDPDLWPRRT
jgi:arsenite-transporting ATPase